VVAYLGGFGSDLHAAAASVAEKNKIPYLGVAFALHKVHQQGFRYLFSPFWKSPDIGQALPPMLNSLPAGERPRTVAIFQEKTDWGREMATAWTEAGKAAGYQVVVNGDYAPGAKDFSDLILKAKSANADAVFALPTPPDGMTMIKQMKELGYTPKLTFFIRAPDPPIWTKNLGKDGDFVVLAPGWHHAVKAPGVKELNDAHQAKIGRPADPIAGPAYACVQILAAAAAKAGADREKLRDAIAATDLTTVVGSVKFRPDGTGVVQSVFLQWLNGKQELVWPRESATAPLAYPAPPFAKR
jgi:branched-chain amino acid transport system substrate-binding protein